jgi:predicted amidohydrolase YtcJ
MPRLLPLVVAASCAVATACSRAPRVAADLVVTHARIWTGDPRQPAAGALAVIGQRIVDIGTVEDLDRWRGPDTRIVDAGERRVIPGFNDAHVHFVDGGAQLENVDLRDAASQAEFARRIAERARSRASGFSVATGTRNDGPLPSSRRAR